ncbi:MAG: NHL repeat-containing protein [Myxococcaceae bacterium]
MAAFSLSAFGAAKVLWVDDSTNNPSGVESAPDGSLLVADKFNQRILRIQPTRPAGYSLLLSRFAEDPDSGHLLPDGTLLVARTAAHRVERQTASGSVIWSYGSGSSTCADGNLDLPSDLALLANGNYLVVDQDHARLLEITPTGSKAWQLGRSDCATGFGPDELAQPFHVDVEPNGRILVAEVGAHTVSEIVPGAGPTGATVIWQFGERGVAGSDEAHLQRPTSARRLPNGDVLIADSDNHRILQVRPTLPAGGTVVWSFGVTGVPGNDLTHLYWPYDVSRSPQGSFFVANLGSNQVLEVSPLRLALSGPGPVLLARRCLGPFRVQVEDVLGDETPPTDSPSPALTWQGSNPNLYTDDACSDPLGSFTLTSASAGRDFYVWADSGDSARLVASAPGYLDGELDLSFLVRRQFEVGPACSLVGGYEGGGWLALLCLAAVQWRRRRSS